MPNRFAAIASVGILALIVCAEKSPADERMDSLVSTEWLAANLDDPDLVVLDCSVIVSANERGEIMTESGRARYLEAHIPGAGFADLKGDLVDSESSLGYAVPAPEAFAAAMAALGVGDNSRVVLYDRGETAWAARVWWMLRWIGFDNAALLDGGLPAWEAEGRSVSAELPKREPASLSVDTRPELIADREDVFAAIDDASVSLIDALPAAQYRGEQVMYARPGHIESAVNVPVFSMLNESGQFRPATELRALFDGRTRERNVTYCGGGIAASSVAFVMTRLGYKDVAVYTASLQEWAADPANPMATGPEPDAVRD
ncbi:MAG: sulfurtransferase [Pseudomonadota bacterium]